MSKRVTTMRDYLTPICLILTMTAVNCFAVVAGMHVGKFKIQQAKSIKTCQ